MSSESCDESCEEQPVSQDEVIDKSTALSQVILKELAVINGKINKLASSELISKLKHYNLDTGGADDVRRKRLKNHYRKIKLTSSDLYLSQHLVPFYVVVDFEATCEKSNSPEYIHEIIEFPGVLVDTTKQEVVASFQQYCKPILRPQLSEFCIELTGITQKQVDAAESFPVVLSQFQEWLRSNGLFKAKNSFILVADGPWDMTRFLHAQCKLSEIPYPRWADTWLNLRKAFSNFYKCQRFCLKSMLDHSGMEFEGRPHCGLDDALNISHLLIRMMCDGANLQRNERICSDKNVGQQQRHRIDSAADQMKNLRLEANARPIGTRESLSTYERVKRDRGAREQKIGRQLIQEERKTTACTQPEGNENTHKSTRRKRK